MAGTTAWAKDIRVVTMYFAGTGAAVNWWNSDDLVNFNIVWWEALNGEFNKPELLATLHRHQKATSRLGNDQRNLPYG